MCFSVESSFAAATGLLPVGAYCVRKAVARDLRFLPLALAPAFFAVQQAAEGFVWYGLRHEDPELVALSMRAFLFFAVAFWPGWVPFSLWFAERRHQPRVILATAACASLGWLILYIHLTFFAGWELHAHVVHHSIDYGLADLQGIRDTPTILWHAFYLSFICGPFLFAQIGGNERRWRWFAFLIVIGFLVSEAIYRYAFASVWCFFAALSSLLLAYAFAGLPTRLNESTVSSH